VVRAVEVVVGSAADQQGVFAGRRLGAERRSGDGDQRAGDHKAEEVLHGGGSLNRGVSQLRERGATKNGG
jgi:hypothetical protein